MALRVVQWTTGNVGKRSVRAIVAHPDIDLVGCYAWSGDKSGRDVGELCGLEPVGVTATGDVDALLGLRPDCVVYNPMWSDTDEVARILEAGVNVVSTATGLGTVLRESRGLDGDRAARSTVTEIGAGCNPWAGGGRLVCTDPLMDASELESLGVYDPTGEHAGLRLELLRYLIELGASADDLVTYREMLPGLAAVLAIRGGPLLTVEDVGKRSGLTIDEVRRLTRTAGFPDPQSGAPIFTEGFAALATNAREAADVFGDEALHQLLRVMGSAMARVADAVVSTFLVNVEPAARRQDPVGLAVAQANVRAATLLPLVAPVLDLLFRQHLLAAQRSVLADVDAIGYETQRLAVGFVDLVGFTELGEQLSLHDLGGVLTSFEQLATDTVTASGGRVVKLIGDEILYTTPDAASACAIALDVSQACRDHPLLPSVRAGLAMGRVMLRDGDVFGPVVNLAARLAKAAQPGEVVATADVSAASGLRSETRGRHRLKGSADDVEVRRLIRN
jgi:class 3 adenylate cyclase